VLNSPDFVLGVSGHGGVLWAAFLEVLLALACIGTVVVLFPVARRQSETAALGFVGARVLEAALIVVGAISLLAVVTLRQGLQQQRRHWSQPAPRSWRSTTGRSYSGRA
jgi:hypothetical protein